MKLIKTISIVLSILLSATCGSAGTITVKAGNVVICDVLTGYIGLGTPYQNLFFKADYVASIVNVPASPDTYTLTTINNDTFSGRLLNDSIKAKLQTGSNVTLSADTIKEAHLDIPGETSEKQTTVFFMKNGDRFSGKLITDKLTIKTDQMDLTTDVKDMERIVFITPGAKLAEIYLNDGSMLAGEIKDNVLHITPDSTPDINICITQFQSIQFNALKYIKKTISPKDYMDPKTSRPQYLSMFPGVSTDITEGGKLCASATPTEKPAKAAASGYKDFRTSDIRFYTNKYDIKPAFIEKLDKIASVLKETPSLKVLVKGYTDNIAGAKYNQALSLRRAYSVARYLEDAGVAHDRISISGYGLTQPIADNGTAEGRALNRRVEIELAK